MPHECIHFKPLLGGPRHFQAALLGSVACYFDRLAIIVSYLH
jgi:hypothetical protein